MSSWSVRPATAADAAEIHELLRVKAERLEALDPRLRLTRMPRSGTSALVAVDADGTVGAHLLPELMELDEDDEMRSFAGDRAVTWRELAASDTTAAAVLVDAVRVEGAGDATLWPAAEEEAAPFFDLLGLEPVFAFALRDPGPLLPGPRATVRLARPEDAAAVSALHVMEVAFHEAHTPHVRVVPGLEPAFRSRLKQIWAGADGASIVHVLEVDGAVAGMCESMMHTVRDEGGQLPPGRYGYLNSVAVSAPLRGRGFGRTLVSTVIDDLAAYGVDGYSLWFALRNPLASRVWPQLGFRPLWISYERRVSPSLP